MEVYGNGCVSRDEAKDKKHCRKWRIVFSTEEGQKRYRFTGTYTEACKERDRIYSELSTPVIRITFRDYALTWLDRRKRSGDIEQSTLDKDTRLVAKLCHQFGSTSLPDLTPPVAIEGLLRIKEDGGLSGTYMNAIHIKLKAILKEALRDKLIPENPLDGIKLPKKDTSERRALDENSFYTFLDVLSVHPLDSHTIGLRIAVLAGLRRGEIVGLVWDDLDDNILMVRRSINERRQVKSPKTASGVRNIPLPKLLLDDLNKWQRIQDRKLAAIGIKQTMDTPIVSSEIGGIMHPQNLDRWWRNNRATFGCDGVVLHELRHTYLTLLANAGTPGRVLQSLAGWTDLKTANIYTHESKIANKTAIDNFEDLLARYEQ